MSLEFWLETDSCKECGNIEYPFQGNLTINLTPMMKALRLSDVIWYPEKNNISKASELVIPLTTAISEMTGENRRCFEKLNPPNGYGSYDGLLHFLKELLTAAISFPNANIYASK